MKIRKHLTEANYDDKSNTFSFDKYKFTDSTKLSFDNDMKITVGQLKSLRKFLQNDGRSNPDKNIMNLLGAILKHFSYAIQLTENFPDLRMNKEFPKDE